MVRIALGGLLFASLCMWGQSARAAWPDDKPVELVVGFAPGGGTDVMARLLGRFLEKRLGDGVRVVVTNKPGSGGEIAASYVQQAKPDGYTIGMINVPGYVFLPMVRKTAYQSEQIRLIARLVDDPAMLVANRGAGRPQTLALIAQALKQAPSSLSVGHAGDGTTGHLGILRFARDAGVQINSVPFKGANDAKLALMGGHVDYVMLTTGEALDVGQAEARLSGVALWAPRRAANGVPTAAEQGYALEISSERGIGAPRGIPDDIANRLELAIGQTLKDPEFIAAAKADAPVLAFLAGEAWQRHLLGLRDSLRPLVALMPAVK